MAKAPHKFPFFFNDWLGGTRHLTPVQRDVYLHLLIHQWQVGYLPRKSQMMSICGISDGNYWDSVFEDIADKFEVVSVHDVWGVEPTTPDRMVLVNAKMHAIRNEELPKYAEALERARQNGAKGGRPKSSSKKPKSVSHKTEVGTDLGSVQNPGPGKGEGGRGNSYTSKRSDACMELDRLPRAIRPTVEQWIQYKDERRESYKPTGLKALITRLCKESDARGYQHVIDLLERAMASGWTGWDHQPHGAPNREPIKKKEEFRDVTWAHLQVHREDAG